MRSRQFKRLGPSLMNQLLAENILPETGLSMKKKGSLFKKGLSKSRVVKRKNILSTRLIKLFPATDFIIKSNKSQLQTINLYSVDQLNIELKRSSTRKTSDFGYQLQQRKKLRWFYGELSTKKLCQIIQDIQKRTPLVLPQFFQEMEQRLDVTLYRSGFFPSLHAARQWILHQRIIINGRIATRPSHKLTPGDFITIDTKWHNLLKDQIFERIIRFFDKFSTLFGSTKYPNLSELTLAKAVQQYSIEFLHKNDEKSVCKSVDDLFDSKTHGNTSRQYKTSMNYSKLFLALSPMKPMNIEISYKTFSIVYLYKPQKMSYPTVFDIQAIQRSY